ncbi:hypothetical protein LINPERPRIM_LOCUS3825 [Linum perenne]
MATLSPFLHFPLASYQENRSCHLSSTPRICPTFSLKKTLKLSRPRSRTVVVHGGRTNSGDPRPNGSQFMDEDGVVEDMDGYMNYLSLEYDSVWDTKPSWCQPWTIALTGVLMISGSWLVLQSVVITAIVVLLVSAWWYIFLYSYPKEYSSMIAERRKRVNSGDEDTFGLKRSQLNEL